MNKNGQTIVELLVAITLITLFLSGVVIIQLFAMRNVQYAQNKSMAAKLAREQLERLRVVRDVAGIDALDACKNSCYINNQLTPVAVAPTGLYVQKITMTNAGPNDCPPPQITITPTPVIYKATVVVSWAQGSLVITPAAQLTLSSCITDWR
jgi:Tfp pilus assembly protein PilV